MKGHPSRIAAFFIIGCLVPAIRAVAGDSPFGLADLEGYRVALAAKPDGSAPMVGFKDLWDRPEAHLGRTVSVEGRVARLFRQPKLGEFPPLVEAWVVSPSGDPFCLVFPQTEGRPTPEIGSSIRFSGTFLKRVEYQGGDVARVAPLIVGPLAPESPHPSREFEAMSWSSADWMMAAGASLVVGLILARRHFSTPFKPSPPLEPPPMFVDGEPDGGGESP